MPGTWRKSIAGKTAIRSKDDTDGAMLMSFAIPAAAPKLKLASIEIGYYGDEGHRIRRTSGMVRLYYSYQWAPNTFNFKLFSTQRYILIVLIVGSCKVINLSISWSRYASHICCPLGIQKTDSIILLGIGLVSSIIFKPYESIRSGYHWQDLPDLPLLMWVHDFSKENAAHRTQFTWWGRYNPWSLYPPKTWWELSRDVFHF